MNIQWGKMVSGLNQVEEAVSSGFDFVQPVNDFIIHLSDNQIREQKSRIGNSGVPFKVCILPLPPEVRVSEKGFNIYVWIDFLKHAMQKMAELGCRTLIWNNGRARLLPVEGNTNDMKEQVRQFLFLLCGVANDFDMRVLVEPLGPRRTNFLNGIDETRDFLSRIDVDNLYSMISMREFDLISGSPADIAGYGALIHHLQLENPRIYEGERVCPRRDDGFSYLPFLMAFKDAGYDEDICLPGDADAGCLAYCRELWKH